MRAKETGAQVLYPTYLIFNSNKTFVHEVYGFHRREKKSSNKKIFNP